MLKRKDNKRLNLLFVCCTLFVTSLLGSTNDWYVDMDWGKNTANVFIDLRKAFDTDDNEIFLAKLNEYGVKGLDHLWFLPI